MFPERSGFVISILVPLLLALAGCASEPLSERITLLPGADGKVGMVVVISDGGSEVRLDQAYGSASVGGSSARFVQSNATEVNERYRATLAATPAGASSYLLYFASEKATLLPVSLPTFRAILDDYRKRPAPEIVVIGHTDKSGDSAYNEELSQRRANAVRKLLLTDGASPGDIETASRGDREPLPETVGKKYDQRNRRVEVKIR